MTREPSATGKAQPPEMSGQSVDDAGITAAVKSRLVEDRSTNLFRVNVDASNGVVYLSGTVGSPTRKRARGSSPAASKALKRSSTISGSLSASPVNHSSLLIEPPDVF